ncbi:unnamed protein product, partial [Iphiclides podalirius]
MENIASQRKSRSLAVQINTGIASRLYSVRILHRLKISEALYSAINCDNAVLMHFARHCLCVDGSALRTTNPATRGQLP